MTPQQSAHFRETITTQLAAVERDMAGAGGAAGIVELDQASVGRLSRMDAMQQQAMAKSRLARLAERRRRLEAALARLEAGSYGRCCACHEELAPERLGVDPAAVFCADCTEERGLS